MKKAYCILALFMLSMSLLLGTPPVLGLENKTVSLLPLADSYVSLGSPEINYGKELFLAAQFEQPRNIVTAYSFTVSPSTYWLKLFLPVNGKISGSFTVTEGGGRDINFLIENDDHTVTYEDESRVTDLEFSFVAPHTGDFYLGFDNSFSWFTSKQVSLSDILLTMEPFNAICDPIFLQFDLSSIPPDATISSAKLNILMSYKNSETLQWTLNSYYCSKNDWTEQTITYRNAPFSKAYLSNSVSLDASGVSSGNPIIFDIKADVVKGLTNGKLTEVLVITGQQSPSGIVHFSSRESENKPKLEISYTYVSVSSSISSSFIVEGQNVAVNAGTDPSQQGGTLKIQYSNDQIVWSTIAVSSGGSTSCAWKPQMTGQVYLRSLWETSWTGGSYSTPSSVKTIYIIPIYLLVLIPLIIVAVIVGIFLWRRRKKKVANSG